MDRTDPGPTPTTGVIMVGEVGIRSSAPTPRAVTALESNRPVRVPMGLRRGSGGPSVDCAGPRNLARPTPTPGRVPRAAGHRLPRCRLSRDRPPPRTPGHDLRTSDRDSSARVGT